ncbi:hypothetical protein J5N97_013846 [Dioscorea zingiberensis]|uniref:Uncharacterized protein n=1 Tax=Dioscorea zingiberensis TaxID=325984 RepID=A0A9D5CTQ9_9LILI|nr:hypothetical protein J5N97_013846 [Dioscorea zingiberensis]
MEDDVGAPPFRLVNFISEDQLFKETGNFNSMTKLEIGSSEKSQNEIEVEARNNPILTLDNGTTVLLPCAAPSSPILCLHHRMLSPTFLLAAVGFLIISYCLIKNIKRVPSYTASSSLPSSPGQHLRHRLHQLPPPAMTSTRSSPPPALSSFPASPNLTFGKPSKTFLYVDILDTTGTLYSMAIHGIFMEN